MSEGVLLGELQESLDWPVASGAAAASRASISRIRTASAPFPASKELNRISMYAGLAATDSLSLVLAFAAASLVRFGEMSPDGMNLLSLALPLFLWSGALTRAYSIDALKWPRHSVKLGLRALLLAIAAIIGILFYLKASTEFSRLVVGAASVFAVITVAGGRMIYGKLVGRLVSWRFTNELLIVDDRAVTSGKDQRIVHAAEAGISPCSDNPLMLDRIGRLTRHCDRIVIACSPARRCAWAAAMKASGTNVEILVPELDDLGPLSLRRDGAHTAVLVTHSPLGLRNRVLKRAFDLILTLPALLILAPVMAICALAIRLDSAGPVLFTQPRVGRSNRLFRVLKFRTMRTDRSDLGGDRSACRDDDRITRVGKLLRRTSLDELPQLLNVLKGEMSLVGPRPHALRSTAEDALFWEISSTYWDRHCVKPGITGLAQVRGHRGATHRRTDLTDRLQADIEYVTDWSLGRDVMILLRTMRVLLHPNAY